MTALGYSPSTSVRDSKAFTTFQTIHVSLVFRVFGEKVKHLTTTRFYGRLTDLDIVRTAFPKRDL